MVCTHLSRQVWIETLAVHWISPLISSTDIRRVEISVAPPVQFGPGAPYLEIRGDVFELFRHGSAGTTC